MTSSILCFGGNILRIFHILIYHVIIVTNKVFSIFHAAFTEPLQEHLFNTRFLNNFRVGEYKISVLNMASAKASSTHVHPEGAQHD